MAVEEEITKEVLPERRSERLKKDVHLTTMEKNETLAKKRSLEGTIKPSQSLSDIDNAELNNLAKCMGVLVHENNFATFDMLKDLESARNCLYAKHQKQTVSEKPSEIVEFAVDKENL